MKKYEDLISLFKLWFHSLFYVHGHTIYVKVDAAKNKVEYWIDHYGFKLKFLIVYVVIIILSGMIFITHYVGFPFWWERSPGITMILCALGYWIIISIIYNFYKICTVSPGHPKDLKIQIKDEDSLGYCKKCDTVKPKRSHHCRVCQICVLKMCHHCLWVNNCVGHNNSRYFYLTQFYTFLGTIFILVFGGEIMFSEMYNWFFGKLDTSSRSGMIIFMALFVPFIMMALVTLLYWFGKLISRGETTIEYKANSKEREKNKNFKNPYDLGVKKNWKQYLGLDEENTLFSIIWSFKEFKPKGNGVNWVPLNEQDI